MAFKMKGSPMARNYGISPLKDKGHGSDNDGHVHAVGKARMGEARPRVRPTLDPPRGSGEEQPETPPARVVKDRNAPQGSGGKTPTGEVISNTGGTPSTRGGKGSNTEEKKNENKKVKVNKVETLPLKPVARVKVDKKLATPTTPAPKVSFKEALAKWNANDKKGSKPKRKDYK